MATNVLPASNNVSTAVAMKQQFEPAVNLATPPSIPHVTNNYIALKTIVANIVLFTHKEFRNILETLPATTSDIAKKRRLLDFIVKTRTEFVKVYVLTKWARISSSISKTIDVVDWLNGQQNCFRNVVSALFGIEKALAGAKLRTPDIETALEVFTAGRPAQSSRSFFPVKKLDSSTILQTLHDLDILLSIRLALTEKLPPEFSRYKIADGRVTFFVENSYQAQLGIADDSVNARFFLVDFKFDFPGAFTPSPQTKSRLELASNEILAKKGLVVFFEMLLKFTQNYKLSTYYVDLKELRRGLFAGLILPKFSPDKSLVTVHYWLNSKSGTPSAISNAPASTGNNGANTPSNSLANNQSLRNTINIGISRNTKKIGVIWYRDNQLVHNHGLEFGQTPDSVESLLQKVASLHVQHIVQSVFIALSRILESNNSRAPSSSSAQAGIVTPSSAPTPSFIASKNVRAVSTQRSIYLQPPRSDQASSPQSPSAHSTASTPNTPVPNTPKASSSEFFNSDPSNHEVVTMITPEKLKIRLTSTRFTVFSIDRLTGRAILTNSTHLISSAEGAINEVQGRPGIIAEVLIKLRLTSIQEEICNRAKATGWIAKSSIHIHPSVVRNRFPQNTRIIFFLRQPSWPERWFLLVTLSIHGIPRWWITQMILKDGTWHIFFSEEISIPNEELGKSYSYKMFDDLNLFTISRIRTEALRKELDRCKIKYRLIQSNNLGTNADGTTINPSPSVSGHNESLPIAMFDISTISEGSKWAEKSVFMRIDSSNEDVIIQGRTKHTLSIGSMPSDDPSIKFNPSNGVFSLFLKLSKSTISLSNPVVPYSGHDQKQRSELIDLITQKFSQIESIVSHISLLRSLSLDIVEASMSKIIFEYGPSMSASIVLLSGESPNAQSDNSDTKPTIIKDDSKPATKTSVIFKLLDNSPHKIVEPYLQKLINAEGLTSVVWVLRKCLPLYQAFQELQDFSKPLGPSRPFNPIIIFPHSLLDFSIQFLRPSGRVCIQLKLVQSNSRPLSVFVSEIFLRDPIYNPIINGPFTAEQLEHQATLQFAPLVPLWRQKSDIPGVIPLQQGLACPMEKIPQILKKICGIVMPPLPTPATTTAGNASVRPNPNGTTAP